MGAGPAGAGKPWPVVVEVRMITLTFNRWIAEALLDWCIDCQSDAIDSGLATKVAAVRWAEIIESIIQPRSEVVTLTASGRDWRWVTRTLEHLIGECSRSIRPCSPFIGDEVETLRQLVAFRDTVFAAKRREVA